MTTATQPILLTIVKDLVKECGWQTLLNFQGVFKVNVLIKGIKKLQIILKLCMLIWIDKKKLVNVYVNDKIVFRSVMELTSTVILLVLL